MWRRTGISFLVFACVCGLVIIVIPGGNALKFVAPPQRFLSLALGLNLHINCTTDDTQATVKLLHGRSPVGLTERVVESGKIMQTGQVFAVVNTGISDAGFYSCSATNVFGNETITWPGPAMVFIIQSMRQPLKVEPADAQIILTGQSIDLTCYSEDIRATTLTWFKILQDNTEVKVPDSQVKVYKNAATNEVKSVLTITNAKKEDSAGYKCQSSHHGNMRSKYGSVTVKDPEVPTIEPYSGKTDVKAPTEKKLNCVAKAFPAPLVTWYRDGKAINVTDCTVEDERKVCKNDAYIITETSNLISVDNTLKIKQTQYLRDHGTYTCEAKNDYGTGSLTINLNVQVAPKLIRKKVLQEKYQLATNVSCELNISNPLPEFEWLYQKISPDCKICKPDKNKWILLPTSKQKIYPASGQTAISYVALPKDQPSTYYSCFAKNSLGNDTNVISFYRRSGNALKFVAPPKQFLSLALGLNLHINCTTDDTQATVKLLHGRSPVGLTERVVESGKIMQTGQVFAVVNTGISDAGYYSCSATNVFGNETAITWPRPALVFIIPSMRQPLKVEPADAQIILTGQSIDLTCYSEDVRANALTWFKILQDNTEVKVPDSQVKVYKTAATNEVKSVLTITNAKKEDSAGYRCQSSRHGNVRSKYGSVTVKGICKTMLTENVDPRVNVTEVEEDFQDLLVLTITGLYMNDSGNYTCTSQDGTYNDFVDITVKARAEPVK